MAPKSRVLGWAGLALARERGIGATSRRAGHFSFQRFRYLGVVSQKPPPPRLPPPLWPLYLLKALNFQFAFGLRPTGGRILKAWALLFLPPFFGLTLALCCEAPSFLRFFPTLHNPLYVSTRFFHPLFIYSTLLCLHLQVITLVVFSLALPPSPPSQALPYPGSLLSEGI